MFGESVAEKLVYQIAEPTTNHTQPVELGLNGDIAIVNQRFGFRFVTLGEDRVRIQIVAPNYMRIIQSGDILKGRTPPPPNGGPETLGSKKLQFSNSFNRGVTLVSTDYSLTHLGYQPNNEASGATSVLVLVGSTQPLTVELFNLASKVPHPQPYVARLCAIAA